MNSALSDIWYQLNFNVSLEIITILKKSLFSHNVLESIYDPTQFKFILWHL